MNSQTKEEKEVAVAFVIAMNAHEGQKRRDGSEYIHHPTQVGMNLIQDGFLLLAAAGFLHDVLEDTDVTEQDLLNQGISQRTVDLVKIVTKEHGMKYEEFIDSILATGDVGAIRIKLADINDNLKTPEFCSVDKLDKYKVAKERLEEALEDNV